MIVDNSTLSAFSKCHIYGALRYWLHRAPLTESLPAKLGQCAHAIMRAHLASEPLAPEIEKQLGILRATAQAQPELNRYLPEAIAKLQSLTTNMIGAYPVVVTPNGPVIIDTRTKVPKYYVRHTEVTFKLPLAEGRHTIIGSIDAVVENEYGNWKIWELKTSRYANGAAWQRQWRLSTQPLTYEFAAQAHTQAQVTGTLIIPFSTASLECSACSIINLEHTPLALTNWQNNVITYLDLLEDIATATGITFDPEGRAEIPDHYKENPNEFYKHASQVLAQLIPTGQFCGNCSNTAFGQCQYYGICVASYNPGYIASQTTHNVWNPLVTYE